MKEKSVVGFGLPRNRKFGLFKCIKTFCLLFPRKNKQKQVRYDAKEILSGKLFQLKELFLCCCIVV